MFPYQIRPRKKVAFAIEKVERSQKPTDEQFFAWEFDGSTYAW
jgi:hypothetical protein